MKTTDSSPILRLREFAKWTIAEGLCDSERAFSVRCGLTNSYISNAIKNTKGDMSTAIVARVAEAFPQLDIEWLITGRGDMLGDGSEDFHRRYRALAQRYRLNMDYKKAYELATKQIEVLNGIIFKLGNHGTKI